VETSEVAQVVFPEPWGPARARMNGLLGLLSVWDLIVGKMCGRISEITDAGIWAMLFLRCGWMLTSFNTRKTTPIFVTRRTSLPALV